MIPRAALVSLFAALLLDLPANASQPERLAGMFSTNPAVTDGRVDEQGLPSVSCNASFAWYESFSPRQVDPADIVTMEMAIIPLRNGSTYVVLRESLRGGAFAYLPFSDGLVRGIPYNRSGWNDVTVTLRPATQDYTIAVNGVTGGPFAYESFCRAQGGCFSMDAFSLHGIADAEGSQAWIDTISLFRESAVGRDLFREVTFDRPCTATYLTTGGLLIREPPQGTPFRR